MPLQRKTFQLFVYNLTKCNYDFYESSFEQVFSPFFISNTKYVGYQRSKIIWPFLVLKTCSNNQENKVGATQKTLKSNLLSDILYIHLSVADHFSDLFKTAKSAKNHCLNSCDKLSQK